MADINARDGQLAPTEHHAEAKKPAGLLTGLYNAAAAVGNGIVWVAGATKVALVNGISVDAQAYGIDVALDTLVTTTHTELTQGQGNPYRAAVMLILLGLDKPRHAGLREILQRTAGERLAQIETGIQKVTGGQRERVLIAHFFGRLGLAHGAN